MHHAVHIRTYNFGVVFWNADFVFPFFFNLVESILMCRVCRPKINIALSMLATTSIRHLQIHQSRRWRRGILISARAGADFEDAGREGGRRSLRTSPRRPSLRRSRRCCPARPRWRRSMLSHCGTRRSMLMRRGGCHSMQTSGSAGSSCRACGWESVQCASGTDGVVSRETLASRPGRDLQRLNPSLS